MPIHSLPLMSLPLLLTLFLGVLLLAVVAVADEQPGDRLLAEYFRAETRLLADRCLAGITTLEEWNARRPEYRRQLAQMFGLWPTPPRGDLQGRVTRRTELEEFVIENVEFQSLPGLYVTGNLYRPRQVEKPLPGILYVCGHGNVKIDGVSYGSKTHYQYHGGWLARNGYVCLIIDTLQLGEIEGRHHGTFDQGRWWWNARGYTPAGVEAWNGIRALDYLQSRPEVDGAKLGMTGRSGGGAYSWSVAALDERVQAVAPVAGITDLENHVVDGVVEGHCDCMYVVNRYRWDYPQLAALVAPRPLLIANTDKDRIFPLEGVVRLHAKVRRIYQLHNAADRLGLLITEGPHKDTQDLQVPVLRWFNRFLKGETPLVTNAATPVATPETLRVWSAPPKDARNVAIAESFVPQALPPPVPAHAAVWASQRDAWLLALRNEVFGGWPADEKGDADQPLELKLAFEATRHGLRFRAYDFLSQRTGEFRLPLRLYVAGREAGGQDGLPTLRLFDEAGWQQWLAGMAAGFAEELSAESNTPAADNAGFEILRKQIAEAEGVTAWVAPRGIGLTAWGGDERKRTHQRRRFMLLGQTLDGMRVWDARRAIQAVREASEDEDAPLVLRAEDSMAGIALYAALFEPGIARLELTNLPASHHEGPDFLNVLKHLDIPQSVAIAAERAPVHLRGAEATSWQYSRLVAKALGWGDDRLKVE